MAPTSPGRPKKRLGDEPISSPDTLAKLELNRIEATETEQRVPKTLWFSRPRARGADLTVGIFSFGISLARGADGAGPFGPELGPFEPSRSGADLSTGSRSDPVATAPSSAEPTPKIGLSDNPISSRPRARVGDASGRRSLGAGLKPTAGGLLSAVLCAGKSPGARGRPRSAKRPAGSPSPSRRAH